MVVEDGTGKLLVTGVSPTSAGPRRTGKCAWMWTTADLSFSAGRDLNVGFLVEAHGHHSTTFFVDDVAPKK